MRFLADTRVRALAYQAACVLAVAAVVAWLAGNTFANLARRGISVGFDFLGRSARFPISESVLPYTPSDSFAWAFVVGLGNTLLLAVLVGALATALGLALALARRSANPLAVGVATVAVETLRNTPLVVQLLFWYAAVTVGLPNVHAALNPLPGVHLSDRGLYLPAVVVGHGAVVAAVALLGAIAVVAAARRGRALRLRTGQPNRLALTVAAGAAAVLALAIVLAGVGVRDPQLGRFNFVGGAAITPESVALLLGLVLYSAAFIGEIIRGGIDAVGVGQWEAGRAIGLDERQTLRLVVIPQALRVIIPPMTSQYVNILKNTTLALVVGYPDISSVTATTINQTGQALEGIVILMAVFLSLSLAGSAFMNWYNRRVALVQR
ncbi:MAG: ABC transporter permease subunit [Phenylobacterium sp.]|uniref:amino acid ABC transporter permease n=1 Tax=Phenylobacterium sp. TaxID=1871053 RepID=UPI001A31243C|nr:ABC transporter permease subunit [Phenylobacterium sp.]MBJ7409483.1 ABC transporter permease subunit [Phenylobacterium sp.]